MIDWKWLASTIVSTVATYLATCFAENKKHQDKMDRLRRDYDRKLADSDRKLADFEKGIEYYRNQYYVVILDGAEGAGKSAFVAKWLDPTLDIRTVTISKTTAMAINTVFLCSQIMPHKGSRLDIRHQVRFHDVPGEKGIDETIDLIHEKEVKLFLLVVDPTRLNESQSRFNLQRITSLYKPKRIRSTCLGCVIYLSKKDIASDTQMETALNWVRSNLLVNIKDLYGEDNVTVISGSALNGDGLVEIQSKIASSLNLSEFFQKHQSRVKC
jgi:signal recognition particle receptor subunit beta